MAAPSASLSLSSSFSFDIPTSSFLSSQFSDEFAFCSDQSERLKAENDAMVQLIDNLDELWFRQNVLGSPKTRAEAMRAMVDSFVLPYSGSDQKLMHSDPSLEIFKDCAGEVDRPRLQNLKPNEEFDDPRMDNQRETVEFAEEGESNFDMELVNEESTDHPVAMHQQNSEPVQDRQSEDELHSELSSQKERHKSVTSAKPHLETIDSGKQFLAGRPGISMSRRRRRERRKRTPSLTDIESDELQGFQDLGFKFSEDDLTPRIVSLVPGLKPHNMKATESIDLFSETSPTRRLYPSEDWWTKKRIETPLQNWQILDTHKEVIDIKEQLKFWAHAVASTVRQES